MPSLRELPRGAAGRDDLDAELGEPAREVHEPALVGHRQQRAPDPHLARRDRLRAALSLARHLSTRTQPRVVRVERHAARGDQPHGTRQQPVLDLVDSLLDLGDPARIGRSSNDSCKTIGPLSTPSSTKCTVTPIDLAPRSRAPARSRRTPGKAGSSDGWTFTIRPAKRRMNVRPQQLHEAGEHDQLGPRARRASRRAPGRARPGRRRPRSRRPPSPRRRAARPLEPARVGAARGHAHDLDRPIAPVDRVEQRLEVRALARDRGRRPGTLTVRRPRATAA